MIRVEDSIKKYGDGALLNIFTTPKSNNALFPSGYNAWRKRIEIKVSSEAKDNKANIEVIKTVAEYFRKPVRDVLIVSGQKNKEKTLFVSKILVDDAVKKLRKSLDGL